MERVVKRVRRSRLDENNVSYRRVSRSKVGLASDVALAAPPQLDAAKTEKANREY